MRGWSIRSKIHNQIENTNSTEELQIEEQAQAVAALRQLHTMMMIIINKCYGTLSRLICVRSIATAPLG
uniref:Uncharacterized protein n=1 Tax=Physcomitrium patens TaxID=3218 RepID=A0A2K1KI38_PHYPA|nr:hypothetical protein PHYPA_007098 [Physcomitrium patens]